METLKNIAFAVTGSFCGISGVLEQMKKLVDMEFNVIPILSETVYSTDTRFHKADEIKEKIAAITGMNKILHKITETEPLGPRKTADLLIISPCTGNTLSKLANGINDSCVTMAAKSILRNGLPVVIGISTNDGLSGSAVNIGVLLNRKNIYFVPFYQDDPVNKQRSLVAKPELLIPAVMAAAKGEQLQPILA